MSRPNLTENKEIAEYRLTMKSLSFHTGSLYVFIRLFSFSSVPAIWVRYKDLFIEMEGWTESKSCKNSVPLGNG